MYETGFVIILDSHMHNDKSPDMTVRHKNINFLTSECNTFFIQA